jgi:sigma-B regulation protein RsbU (phosphoserine phosphatase)
MNADFPRSLERRIQDLTLILEVSRSITAEKNLDQLLHLITTSATKVMDADRSSLFLVDEKGKELFSKIAQGSSEIRFPIGAGIAGSVAQTKEIINIPEAYKDSRFNQEFDRRSGYKTETILCAPLMTHEKKVVGVLQVLNKKQGVFNTYDEYLLKALANHAAIALDNAQLIIHYSEKQKLEQSMSIAREIQQSLLPLIPPQFKYYDIFGINQSCEETGGDYFDFIQISDTETAIIVGDVSGHGLGSALVMVSARSSLIGLVEMKLDISEVLYRLNNQLERDMNKATSGSEHFMTLLLGVLDHRSHEFYYTSAGHDPPILYRKEFQVIEELESTGLPLGMFGNSEFPKSSPLSIAVGDIFLCATDGLWESKNSQNEDFGKDRIIDILREFSDKGAQDLIKIILKKLEDFTQTAPQKDDITLIILKRIH